MALCWVQAVRTTTRTTTGTQDISIAGFGTVKGAIVLLTRATADATVASHLGYSIGFTDGTNQLFSAFASEDNVADSNSGRQSGNDKLGKLIKTDISGYDIVVSFDSSITDGIRLNYTTVDGTAYLITVILLGGPDTSVFVGAYDAPDANPYDVTTVGFMPDCVIPLINNAFGAVGSAAPSAAIAMSIGLASEPSSGVFANYARAYSMGDAKATATPSTNLVGTDMTITIRDAASAPFTTTNTQRMTARLSNGFTSDEQVSADPAETGFMAIRFGGTKTQILAVDSPTATGDVTTSTNYPVGAIFVIGTVMDAFGAKGDSQAGGWSLGFASRNEAFCNGVHEEDAAATMNNGCFSDDTALNVLLHDGTAGLVASASLGQTNFTLSFTTVLGSARKQIVLVMPQADFTSTGSGSFPLATGAGTGSLTFDATGAGTFPLATGAGVGSLTFQGTGSGTFPLATGAATGSLTFQGTGAGSFPLAQAAGVALLAFQATGAGTFPLATGSGTALEVFQGTGAGSFAVPVGAGIALLVFQATASGSFPLPSGSGVAQLAFQGTGAGSFPLVLGAGTASLVFVGTGAGSFPLPIGDALALLVFQATGVGFFPLPTALGLTPRPDLACEADMEGDYDPNTALTGDYDPNTVLGGNRAVTSALLANYSVVKALSGDYKTTTDLEGDNC
jgi:hypothetical protein